MRDSRLQRSALLVIAALFGIGLFVGTRDVASGNAVSALPSVVNPGTPVSEMWVCGAGSSSSDGPADETIVVSNLSKRDVRIDVTVYVTEQEPVVRGFVIRGNATERIRVSDIAQAADPLAVVRAYGGPVVVEHELSGFDDVVVGPCTNKLVDRAYFAAGTTVRGVQQFLILANPTATDLKVDVQFFTADSTGTQKMERPENLQGFDVPRYSKVVVPVHNNVRRTELVGTQVTARVGRFAAEQLEIFDGSEGRQGIALSNAVSRTATEWVFPSGIVTGDRAESVVIANPGDENAAVELGVFLDSRNVVEPQELDVPAQGVVQVNLADIVPADAVYAIRVSVQNNAAIVVERRVSRGGNVATSLGIPEGSARWIVSPARVNSSVTQTVSVFNPGSSEREFSVVQRDRDNTVTLIKKKKLQPGARQETIIDEGSLEAYIEITADGEVVVDTMQTSASAITIDGGIPGIE